MNKEKYRSGKGIGIFMILFGLVFGGIPTICVLSSGEFISDILVFLLFGILCIAAGIGIIFFKKKKENIINDLIEKNEHVYAEFHSIKQTDHFDDEDSWSTYAAVFCYTDESGRKFWFKSGEYDDRDSIPFEPGDTAKVFVNLSDPKVYMVSLNDTIHSQDPKYIVERKKILTWKVQHSFSEAFYLFC